MFHFLADSGVPDEKLPDLAFASMVLKSMVTMAEPDVLFEDQKEIELPGWRLRTIWTPGHSPGHVCFHSAEQRLLLSGDHILPRITPNISVHAQQFPNPLGDYLESLAKVRDLGTDEVLPAHEYRFADLGSRIDEITAHHAERLEEIVEVIRAHPGSTALGDHPPAALVAPVGRDRAVHAAPGQRRDPGPLRAARAARPGASCRRRPCPVLRSSTSRSAGGTTRHNGERTRCGATADEPRLLGGASASDRSVRGSSSCSASIGVELLVDLRRDRRPRSSTSGGQRAGSHGDRGQRRAGPPPSRPASLPWLVPAAVSRQRWWPTAPASPCWAVWPRHRRRWPRRYTVNPATGAATPAGTLPAAVHDGAGVVPRSRRPSW